ncbi:glycosyltransferase family 2 protein [Microbacterium terricola]|uniref:Glycosyl transferase n=1 Tax=Microbacterium terricola TaxID=344163 RepID=A0ABM8DV06_9MICO|nr:glycosyltransferase [Microbacterium terricola]UYK39737.1 glycosyltransferase [Microbacterium terricola]BDV29514.1 glycosyl transferase [Microbacterium terricola]
MSRSEHDQAPTVVIGVPTYRRPSDLRRLLHALGPVIAHATDAGAAARVDVLVVDNDPDASARAVVAEVDPTFAWVHEPEPGVAAARNRVLAESDGRDVLVFIDDDESPAADSWLTRLLETRGAFSAHVVSGPVVTVVDGGLDPWIEAGGFFARRHRADVPTGSPIERAATNNLLLDLAFVRAAGIRFDPRFGRTGGEDSLFTSQLHRAGAHMVWCADALVRDHLPAARQTRAHALARMRGMAAAGVRVGIVMAPTRARRAAFRARATLAGTARIGAGAARTAAGAVVRSVRLDATGRRDIMRGIGGLEGAAGHVRIQYGDLQEGPPR